MKKVILKCKCGKVKQLVGNPQKIWVIPTEREKAMIQFLVDVAKTTEIWDISCPKCRKKNLYGFLSTLPKRDN